eukprot:Hpha_TRINITY_DN25940_c0_g1::TRINITY_DN25940_c0_g1_i1::g.185225::m.185225
MARPDLQGSLCTLLGVKQETVKPHSELPPRRVPRNGKDGNDGGDDGEFYATPYPSQLLRIPGKTSALPPHNVLVRAPPKATSQRASRQKGSRSPTPSPPDLRLGYSTKLLPGPGGVTGWRPAGCGCWVDPSGLLARIRSGDDSVMPQTVLSPCMFHQLILALPSGIRWAPWWLVYSTDEHGYSQRSLRTRATGVWDMLLVVGTTQGDVFGAFLPNPPPRQTRDFEGSGDTFVWTFRQGRFESYFWSKENVYFMRSFSDGSWG